MLAAVNTLRQHNPGQIVVARRRGSLSRRTTRTWVTAARRKQGARESSRSARSSVSGIPATVTLLASRPIRTSGGGAAERKIVRPALPGSFEERLHEVGDASFAIPFPTAPRSADALPTARLQHAIGVIYRPSTERQSHYFRARPADQFDVVIHIDDTRAATSGLRAVSAAKCPRPFHTAASQVGQEPVRCQTGDLLERARLLEQVCRTTHNDELPLGCHSRIGGPVEAQDLQVIAAND